MNSIALFRRLVMIVTGAAVAAGVQMAGASHAHACGCFAPPDPSVPIVQTGERIVFGMDGDQVVAHIQIQYSGNPEEFAWLVPISAVPEVGVGTDELFTQLINTTQPKYLVNREYMGTCGFDPSRFGGVPDSAGEQPPPQADPGGPLIVRDTVGPYDYAVLSAANKDEMLNWLTQERFFVPAGTDQAVGPYIRPGAYFLALKLRKGNDVGDLQPVVLRYRAALPMIPIVLTSVAADPDMGILVWMVGQSRAIPRNYFHTVINDAQIDWLNFGSNYVDVITRAVDEAEGHHSFVTEYAGTSAVMRDVLDYSGRFGDISQLAQLTDAVDFVEYLLGNGYAGGGGQLLSILERELPMPAALAEQIGMTPAEYYGNMRWVLGPYRADNPELFVDVDLDFDPVALAAEIDERIVQPTLAAGRLFRDHPYMTRLFTTISPDEMNRDPVFSFNPDLPDVSNVHQATLTYFCGTGSDDQARTPARLVTEQGWVLSFPDGTGENTWQDVPMPASQYTQVLREEGEPEVVGDNNAAIDQAIDEQRELISDGCVVGVGASHRGMAGMLLLGAVVALGAFRRRRRG